ncbi:MotA/TolQ/ExbB proton channel family protein [Methylacidiphilales bacterium]|nr:MotA/TolQ/ExbB proton channel family protein [Candidatus Methylacidiphilales bacterium]
MSSTPLTYLKTGLLALILLAGSVALNSLPAQDTGAPAAPTADAGSTDTAKQGTQAVTMMEFLGQGGPAMWVLGFASVCVVWFTAEGFVNLRARKLAPPALVARLREAFSAGNYQEAWNICKTNRCFLSSVLGAGLERIGKGKDAVEFAVEETAIREGTILKTNMMFLSVIGVVSPMVGLTGTVIGMIKAFHTLGENGISNPSQLAGNIGEVLVATASGLIVAIPAFVFFYVLRALSQGAVLKAEAEVYYLLDDIPYEQLSGIKIGENFSPDPGSRSRSSRAGTSQKVSRDVTTNCPACNAPITVGVTPCPNCGTVLDWGS